MEKQKHTPGPWKAVEGKDFDGEKEIVIRGHEQGRIMRIANAWLEANACLIAAAPELLEACKVVEGYLQALRSVKYATSDKNPASDGSHHITLLQVAIAKAEGEEKPCSKCGDEAHPDTSPPMCVDHMAKKGGGNDPETADEEMKTMEARDVNEESGAK